MTSLSEVPSDHGVEPMSRKVPLSYQQTMYWEAEQQRTIGYRLIAGNDYVANAFGAFRIKGALDVGILGRSLNEVLRRHESLRMRFETNGGRTVQIITNAVEVPLECLDVSRTPRNQEDAVGAAAAGAALGRFDYTSGILLRAHIIRLSDLDAVVVLTIPHMVSDSVSIQILINEVLTLYAHFVHGRPSPLPDLEVQYSDYVRWQQAWVRSHASKAADDYVDRRLVGVRPLVLPRCDRHAEGPPRADAGEIRVVLDERVRVAIHALCTRQRVTPFVVVLSAFNVFLSRWTRQTDVLQIAALAARPDPSTQKVIGLFSNLCPLRSDLSADPRFTDVLEQGQERVLEAMRYRCLPYAVIADSLRGRGDISCTGVGVNAVPDGGAATPRGCSELFGSRTQVSPYVVDTGRIAVRQIRGHLCLWIGGGVNGAISARLIYRRASFEPPTIADMGPALLAAIDALTQHPQRRISTVVSDDLECTR